MTLAIKPKTDPGRQVIEAAASVIEILQAHAGAADQENSMAEESIQALKDAHLVAAFVPQALGGFGLASIHDWTLAIATLARGDAAIAIAINMHLGVSRGMALAYYGAQENAQAQQRLSQPLKQIAAGDMLICATATEPGTDNLHPRTEAVANEHGWVINGQKIFVTMSPVATHLGMNLRMRDEHGDHLVSTLVPIDSPGLEPQNDWDALGMRGSGSQSVKFKDLQVPSQSIRKIGPWGQWSIGMLMNRAVANLPLVGAFLGIAEAAHDIAMAQLATQSRVGQPVRELSGVQTLVGEMEIELAKCRSILSAAATAMDDYLAADEAPTLASAHNLMKDYQAAKWVVNRGAIDIVSKAMDLLGGAGYTNKHPLARLYRDVRAGPFMQPFAPTEAREYVGQVALECYPER